MKRRRNHNKKLESEITDEITFNELQKALKIVENAKVPRENVISTELYKYASGKFKGYC